MVRRTVRRTPTTIKGSKQHNELMAEITGLKELSHELKAHGIELEKDLREARTLLYISMAVLMALFGLVLGISLRVFL